MTTFDTKYFKSLLMDVTTGILVVSSERLILEANPRFCQMFGYENSELLGCSVEMLHVDREQYEAFGAWFRQALLGEGPLVQTEWQYRHKDGSLFWGLISGVKSQVQEQTNGVVWSLIDITDRKLAEAALHESELKFRTIAEYMYDWEYWRAPDGSLVYCSPSCERITGYSAEEFLSNPELLSIIIHPDDRELFAHHLNSEAHNWDSADCHQAHDFRICTKNGEERWMAHVCQRVFDQQGTHLGRRASNRDITQRKQIEESLKKVTLRHQAILSAVSDIIMEVNSNKVYTWANRAGLDFFGDDVVGKEAAEYFEREQWTYELVQPLFRAEQDIMYVESWQRRRDGEPRLLAWWCKLLKDENGSVAGALSSARDITEHKQTEEELRTLNRQLSDTNEEMGIINSELELRRQEAEKNQSTLQQLSSAVVNSPAMIIITDQNGSIEYTNPKFTEITGYHLKEVVGQSPKLLSAGLLPKEFYQDLWETILAGREWHGDFCNRKKQGEIYWEHASISPIKDEQGTITHFVAIKEDITKDKQIAEELQAARDAADAANRSKSEFLANMSHEIRTPLNAIIGFSALTLKTGLQPQQQEYIGKIHTAGELLLNIINDILDFSKIEARKLHLEQIPFRLAIVLANASSLVQQKALEKGLKLLIENSPEIPPCLIGDPHRLVQIITNLLSNAVKFTTQGEVVLKTDLLEQQPERIQLRFSVRDTGIGIPPEQINSLFQPFTQADGSTTRRFGGTGLGLSISRQLVELMGGEISCESRPEQGSTFSFTAWFGIGQPGDLVHSSADTPGGEPGERSFNFSGARILLVEDNEMNQQLVFELLKNTGAVVDLAVNGKEAVSVITNGSTGYDLVLMDIQMPVMDGYEATRQIRQDSRFAALPILAMTANALQEDQQAILQTGMNAWITKPVNALTMLQTVAAFLQPRAPSESLGEAVDNDSNDDTVIPVIPGLDSAAALSRLGGDTKLFLWLLDTFVESKADAAQHIQEALNSGDAVLAARQVHTLKGLAGNIGAVELERLAKLLENAIAGDEPPECIMPALELLSSEVDRLVMLTKEFISQKTMPTDTGTCRLGDTRLELDL